MRCMTRIEGHLSLTAATGMSGLESTFMLDTQPRTISRETVQETNSLILVVGTPCRRLFVMQHVMCCQSSVDVDYTSISFLKLH